MLPDPTIAPPVVTETPAGGPVPGAHLSDERAGGPAVADPPPGSPPDLPAPSSAPAGDREPPSATPSGGPELHAPRAGAPDAAAYMRGYRAGKGGKPSTEDGEQYAKGYAAGQRDQKPAKAGQGDKPAAPVKVKGGPPAKAPPPAPAPKVAPSHVKSVEDALTGGIGALSSAVVVLALHPDAPTPDEVIVRKCVSPWAPLLAKYITPGDEGALAIALAAGSSVAHAWPYVRELRTWVKENPDKVKPPPVAGA